MQKLIVSIAIFSVIAITSGCSVAMAAKQREGTDLTVVSQGISRAEVEEVLGAPLSTTTSPDGEWATYQYVTPKEASGGRAIAHGAMDILTLGLWEIAGTPIEESGDEKYGKIQVLYSNDEDIVVRARKITDQ
jgi:hypothetical protein